MNRARDIMSALTRRKRVEQYTDDSNNADRRIDTLNLISVGLGNRLVHAIHGTYIYMARYLGPAVVMSYLFAVLVNILSALCYAELASRMPKAGSAYAYSYVTMGELVAFITGWSLVLKNIAAAAFLIRITSLHLAYLAARLYPETLEYVWLKSVPNQELKRVLDFVPGINTHRIFWLDKYSRANWLSILVTSLAFGFALVGFRRKRSQMICVAVTLSATCFIFVGGFLKAKVQNWQLEQPPYYYLDSRGFFPLGVENVDRLSKHCYFAFTGFDGIVATKGVVNPSKSIPRSILWTAGINSLIYIVGATFPTLVRPYYQLSPIRFFDIGWVYDRGLSEIYFFDWAVKIGLIAGLAASFLVGFSLGPNLLCAMAEDRVIFEFFSKLRGRRQVPIIGTLFIGLLVAYYACVFTRANLLSGGSIAALLAYSLVSISVLLLRYEQADGPSNQRDRFQARSLREVFTTGNSCAGGRARQPDRQTTKISRVLIGTQLIVAMLLAYIVNNYKSQLLMMTSQLDVVLLVVCSMLVIQLLLLGYLLNRLPVDESAGNALKLPLGPAIPLLSLSLNFYLLMDKSQEGLEGFLIWSAFGLVIYFSNAISKTFRNTDSIASTLNTEQPRGAAISLESYPLERIGSERPKRPRI